MSSIKLTKSQQQFVDSFNKNTLVSASAGSGKTSTMIAKLTYMIVNNIVSVKNLLVVTYTNSAGSEMKQKLYNSLVDALQNEENEERIELISSAIDDMVNCDIGTLHGICKKIISSYFYVVEQDPAFTLLNEQQSSYMFDNAMESVFNKYVIDNDENFYSLYKILNKKRNMNNLKYVVKTIYNYLLSKVDADNWKNKTLESIRNKCAEEDFLNYYKAKLNEYVAVLSSLKQECVAHAEKFVDYVGDRLNFALAVNEMLDYGKFCEFVHNYQFVTKPRVKESGENFEIIEKIKLVCDEFSDLVKELQKNCVVMTSKDYDQYYAIVKRIFDIVDCVGKEYFQLKKQQNALDFSDLEHITLKILENDGVVSQLREKYKYIFVDEYQDINQVQEEIISRLKCDDNLFMIGDVKQSIYAFRLSSPEIFIKKYNDFYNDGNKNQVINLNENFRSEGNILSFANLIFNTLITKNTIGIDYKATSQLVAGKSSEEKCCVSLDIVDSDKIAEDEVIVQKIGELIEEGYNYRDIAILVRSKSEIVSNVYSRLKAHNIPCEATYKTQLFKNAEVLVIYYLLKLINNTYDDIAMATVLKGFFVGLTDNDLAKIRNINNDSNFYECVYEYANVGTDENIKKSIMKLLKFVKNTREGLYFNTLIDVVEDVFHKYDVFNYYLSFVDGVEKVSNLKEFLRLISNDEYKYDLPKCIDYLDSIKKDGVVNLTLSSTADSVKIMTIHASKGLEFPAVILAETAKKFVLNKQTEDIVINDNLGVGLNLYDIDNHTMKSSIIKNVCKLRNKKSEIDEEIRLLYVALTRAKRRLCIVGTYDTKNVDYTICKDVYNLNSYMQLILKAIPQNEIIKFKNKIDNFVVCAGEPCEFVVKFHKNAINDEKVEAREVIINGGDEEIESILKDYFSYEYPHNTYSNIAVKNSVSQVLKEEVDYENSVDSITNSDYISNHSMQLGTAYHSIMQNLNYSENKADIFELIEKVKTPDLPYDEVDIDKIMCAIEKVKLLINPTSKILKEQQFIMRANYGEIVKSSENVNVLIQGVIDLVIINDDSAIIIDFKTNKTKNKKYLLDKYALQLNMYASAFAKAYKVKIAKKLLYSFEIGDFVEV